MDLSPLAHGDPVAGFVMVWWLLVCALLVTPLLVEWLVGLVVRR